MNAFQFLDIQFQKRAVDISKMKSDTYDVKVGGEAQALRMLLECLRVFYKWYAVPKIILQFWAVKLHLMDVPISPLIPKEAPSDKKPLAVVPNEGDSTNGQDTSEIKA